MHWQWVTFDELTNQSLYDALLLRQQVFTVEQNCHYQDCDGYDKISWHLLGWSSEDPDSAELVAYLRVMPPDTRFPEYSLSRIATAKEARGKGLGRELISQALSQIEKTFGKVDVRIAAQKYLIPFFESFGFTSTSSQFYDMGLPHVEMLKNPEKKEESA